MKRHRDARAPARNSPLQLDALFGRRVAVPESFFGFDDEGFTFKGIITQTCSRKDGGRGLVRFEYTGEEEWFTLELLSRWLEEDDEPLCKAFKSAALKSSAIQRSAVQSSAVQSSAIQSSAVQKSAADSGRMSTTKSSGMSSARRRDADGSGVEEPAPVSTNLQIAASLEAS